MPIIYRLTFPNGKSYIGQTKREIDARVRGHISQRGCCPLVYAAIEEFGKQNMQVEVLIQCNVEHLNEYEVKFIRWFDTLYPFGYNIMRGGGVPTAPVSEETKEKIRISSKTRKYTRPRKRTIGCEWNLPMYVKYCEWPTHNGFTVRIPGKGIKSFTSQKLSIEEKHQLAMEHYNKLMQPNLPND